MADRSWGVRDELRAAVRGQATGDDRIYKIVEEIRRGEGLGASLPELGTSLSELGTGMRAELLSACTAELADQAEVVTDEYAYGLTRALCHHVAPAAQDSGALPPYLGRVGLDERDGVLARIAPARRTASVAVPLVDLGTGGFAIGISRRSFVNGYTGGPMSNAGEVVLFGGAAEPGELPALTAVRELVEEAGIDGGPGDLRYDPYRELGTWTTEAGFRATGFLVNVPPGFPAALRPDVREVQDVGFVTLDALFQAPFARRHHLVTTVDAARRPVAVGWYESPTALVTDVDGGRQWLLWGLAGHMLSRLRAAYPSPEALVAHSRTRRLSRAGRRYLPDMACGGGLPELAVAAHRVRDLMRGPLGVPRPPLVRAPVLSELLGEPVLLALDGALPRGGSTKVRALSGLMFGALEALAEAPPGDGPLVYRPGHERESLAALLDGAVFVAASTGSHAYAVLAFSRWLRAELGIATTVELFLSSDISDAKARRLTGPDVSTSRCAHFNAATRQAHAREEYLNSHGRRAVFLPSDPERRFNAGFSISGMDSTIGLATLLLDVADGLAAHHEDLGLSEPAVREVRIPTSGGATWASCVALAAAPASALLRQRIGAVAAVYDEASPTVPAALAADDPTTVVTVDWTASINGLAQPEIAPGVWDLLRVSQGEGVPRPLYPVTRAAATVARELIRQDTGLRAQLAGAAATGSALLAHLAYGGRGAVARVAAALPSGESGRDLHDALERCASDAERVRARPAGPPGPRVYVVSGGEPGPE